MKQLTFTIALMIGAFGVGCDYGYAVDDPELAEQATDDEWAQFSTESAALESPRTSDDESPSNTWAPAKKSKLSKVKTNERKADCVECPDDVDDPESLDHPNPQPWDPEDDE